MYVEIFPLVDFQRSLTTLIAPHDVFFRANDVPIFVGYNDRGRLSGKKGKQFPRVRDVPGIPHCCFKRRILDYRLVPFDRMIEILRTCPVRTDFTADWTNAQLVERFLAFFREGRAVLTTTKPMGFFNGVDPHLVVRAVREGGVPMQTWFPEYRRQCERYCADKLAYQRELEAETLAAARPTPEEIGLLRELDRWTGGDQMPRRPEVAESVVLHRDSADEWLPAEKIDGTRFDSPTGTTTRWNDVVRLRNKNRWEYYLRVRSREMIDLLVGRKDAFRTVRPE